MFYYRLPTNQQERPTDDQLYFFITPLTEICLVATIQLTLKTVFTCTVHRHYEAS